MLNITILSLKNNRLNLRLTENDHDIFFLFQVKPILQDTKVPLTQHIALEKYLNQTYLANHKLYIKILRFLIQHQ